VLHPGVTSTGFGTEDTARGWGPLIAVMRLFMKTPDQGADTSVYLASSVEAEGLTGQYFAGRRPTRSHKASYDTGITARLWQRSADLVALPTTAASERPSPSGGAGMLQAPMSAAGRER
jgi:hypothetical protein